MTERQSPSRPTTDPRADDPRADDPRVDDTRTGDVRRDDVRPADVRKDDVRGAEQSRSTEQATTADRVRAAEQSRTTEQATTADRVREAQQTRTPEHGQQPVTQQSAEQAAPAPLLSGPDLEAVTRRWHDIQAGFVDAPQDAVKDADALVADLMNRLAQMFATERAQLESHWSRGDQVSTEELRVSLQRYRSFFQRLLSVH